MIVNQFGHDLSSNENLVLRPTKTVVKTGKSKATKSKRNFNKGDIAYTPISQNGNGLFHLRPYKSPTSIFVPRQKT